MKPGLKPKFLPFFRILPIAVILFFAVLPLFAQQVQPPPAAEQRSVYRLGPLDVLAIRTPDMEESATERTVRINPDGHINLPLIGRVLAAGLTVQELEQVLAANLKAYYKDPQVGVSMVEFRSQTASVLGLVNNPGVQLLQGSKTLLDVISMAGGIKPEASSTIRITRRKERGPVPLPTVREDATGRFAIAEVNVRDIIEARTPELNILVMPDDIITVLQADLIYVVGEVTRPGTVVLSNQDSISVMQILAIAGGTTRAAATNKCVILRSKPGEPVRTEIPLDINRIKDRKAEDVALLPNDILLVPGSAGKQAALRALEAAVSIGTGILTYGFIYRR